MAVTMAVAGSLFGVAQARADQIPGGCRASSLTLSVSRDVDTVRNGDVVTYTIRASNNEAGSCNVTGATFQMVMPAGNGTPTGQTVTIGPTIDVPAGTTSKVIGSATYTVALNPGVITATARASVAGTAHDQAVRVDPTSDSKDISIGAVQAAMTMTKTASPTSGQAPLTATYTYTVTNISTTPESIANVTVSDNLCSPVTFVAGDANGNSQLDVGETFTFTCASTYRGPGTFVNTATSCGKDTTDNRDVCAGPVQATVVVTSPPVVVNASQPVKSASEKCIAVPKTLSLRAKELTTVKVTVNAGDGALKGAEVKISGPGFSKTAKTDAKGVATFKVRPSKKGTLVVKSDRCLQAERSSVKAARQTQSRQVPRVTG